VRTLVGVHCAMVVGLLVWCAETDAQEASKAVGIFEGHGDVGKVEQAGSTEFDAMTSTYAITGSGENMWFGKDAFEFAWKKVMVPNVSLTADIAFVGEGKNGHRKAVLMVRQNLDEDAVYADGAVHGSGLTSLQFRDERGALTREVQSNVDAPKRVRIVKEGDYFRLWVAGVDGKFMLAGATGKIVLTEPFYVGIGVCSHDNSVVETAKFANVELREFNSSTDKAQSPGGVNVGARAPTPNAMSASDQRSGKGHQGADAGLKTGATRKLYSMMEIIDAESLSRRAIYVAEGRYEAPNWMPDGKRLLFNRNGRIETIPVEGGAATLLDTGFAARCNNDHGISPDGKWLVVSDNSAENHESLIYLLPIGGGTPRRITKNGPSYWHGWSPDGRVLAFVGQRNGEFDIYNISTEGGEEKQLTTAKGLDDGPEYTPDGRWIYFNSVRTGQMHIWKMKPDGSEQTQVTFDDANDWFPHFSPDGQKMVFLTFDRSVEGHPENKDVMLRIMNMKDGKITVAAKLFGGQGTINVPSWSPDGRKFAFVSYAMVEDAAEK
jgi:TolB protein